MPGLRLTRSSSSASLKLWERQSKKATMTASTQSLMQDLHRSDASQTGNGKRRSFLLRRKSSRQDEGFSDDFSQACPGSISSQIPDEEGIEAIRPPRPNNRRSASKTTKKKAQLPPSPSRPSWRCLPSPTDVDPNLPPVLTASSVSEDSRHERFDQSFDYAFNSNVWEKSVLDSSLVDTTFASNSSSSSCRAAPVPVDPIPPPPAPPIPPTPSKSKSKWRLFSWNNRRKVERTQSFQGPSNPPTDTLPQEFPTNTSWPLEPELEDEPDWEAHMDGDQVECEYRGDVTVQDLFATAPDSPTIQRVSSWGMEQPKIGLEKSHEDQPLPNSVAVMELGQYAREMQSKHNKPSPVRKRQQLASLLCALPGIGKSKAKEDDHDFPDPDLMEPDESWDDNSYLAVSYTEEGAQLVIAQSEDLDRVEEEHYSPQHSPVPDMRKEESEDSSPAVDPLVDISQLTGDEDLHFLGENPILSYRSGGDKHTSSLGATFPHPAAQMREELAMRRLRHPSPPMNETPEIPSRTIREKVTNESTGKPQLAPKTTDTALKVEKEARDNITYHHYKGPTAHETNERSSKDSSVYTPSPARTMRSNMTGRSHGKSRNEITPGEEENPRTLKRRDDPSTEEEPPRSYGFYGCPTTTTMPPSYPTCTSRSAPRWLSQSTDMIWDQTTARTLDSRTVSTLSYSVYPLQERHNSFGSSTDIWDLYQPIRQMAKDVNETFCENMYPRMEQPASVPFDEYQMDGRLRQSRSLRSKSSSSSNNYYERFLRDNERTPRQRSFPNSNERRPDPPSTMSGQRDRRRQLL